MSSLKYTSCLLDAVEERAKMLIPSAYISFRRRNKFQRYFKVRKKHVDEPVFESDIWGAEEKVPIPPENDYSSSESEHDGEGLSFRDISNVVNQAVDVVKHPNKLIKQAVEVIKYPVKKLVSQVEHVIRHPEDILHRLVPVKGAGLVSEGDQMADNDVNSNDAQMDEGEIEDELGEPDAKVAKIEDFGCFDRFQRAGVGHTPCRIPPTDKRKYPQRRCKGCRSQGIKRDARYYCRMCPDNPVLCKHCFDTYHIGYNMNE